MPTLKVAKTLWGVDEAADTGKWDALFARIKAEGFDGVEAIALTWRADPALFTSLLTKHGLALICQIHTTGGDIVDGEYVYCSSCKLDDHIASFKALATEAAALKPVLINSHSGHDSWGSGHNARAFFRHALQVEARLGVPVVHETHRQRLLYSPYPTAELLALPELAALKINADLSHWCCVCEHIFDAADPRDAWWPACLQLVARHCHFVHCRVGHTEGPQVTEPDAPEFSAEKASHFGWWRAIWRAQAERGMQAVWAEPEHGPPPYLQTRPHTKLRPSSCLELFTKGSAPADMADLWDVNSRVARQMREQHAAAIQGVGVSPPTPEPVTSQSRLERELHQLNLQRAAQQDEHVAPLAKDPVIRPMKPPA